MTIYKEKERWFLNDFSQNTCAYKFCCKCAEAWFRYCSLGLGKNLGYSVTFICRVSFLLSPYLELPLFKVLSSMKQGRTKIKVSERPKLEVVWFGLFHFLTFCLHLWLWIEIFSRLFLNDFVPVIPFGENDLLLFPSHVYLFARFHLYENLVPRC